MATIEGGGSLPIPRGAPGAVRDGSRTDGSSGSSGADQAAAFGGGFDADEPETVEEAFGEQFFWQESVVDKMADDIKAVASKYDMDLDFVLGWFQGQKVNLINYLQNSVIATAGGGPGGTGLSPEWFTNTPAGIQNLFTHARNWLGARFPALLDGLQDSGGGSGSGRGRSGGGGPTPDQIRAQFDIDELTEAANAIWRGSLLEAMPDARAAAAAYVEQIVANPEQKLDYETFILNKVKATSRYKYIYRNKPEGMTDQQFLMPLYQQVQQTIGRGFGTQGEDIAINAARLGASPTQLSERLQRERQVQTSAPFLSALGERMSEFKEVLR